MGNYNPHKPRILGQEFAPIRNVDISYSPGVNTVELGWGFQELVPTVLANGRFYVKNMPNNAVQAQCALINIYPAGQEAETGPIEEVFIPCNQVQVTGAGISAPGAASAVEAVYQFGDFKNIEFDYNAAIRQAAFWFDVNNYPQLAGKRILNVSLMYSGNVNDLDPATNNAIPFVNPTGFVNVTSIRQRNDGGTQFTFPPPTSPSNTGSLTLTTTVANAGTSTYLSEFPKALDLGDINNFWSVALPPTISDDRMPWRYQELQRFDPTFGANRQHILLRVGTPITPWQTANPGGIWPLVQIGYMALRVIFCEETRIITGARNFIYSWGMNSVTLRDVATYSATPTLPAGSFTPTLSFVSSGQTDFGQNTTGAFPDLNGIRELYALPSHPGVQVNVPFPLSERIGTTFTKETTHTLPQLSLNNNGPFVDVQVYGQQAIGQVYSGVNVSQTLDDSSLVAPATYTQARFYARRFGDTISPLSLNGISPGGLAVPGTAGNYASTPDNAALDIVGDIDLRAEVTLGDWTPVANPRFVAKYTLAGNQRSYAFGIQSSGQLVLLWSNNGIAQLTAFSSVSVPTAPAHQFLRVTLDVDNGAAGNTAVFFTGTSLAGPWTQLGTPVIQAGVTAIFSSTAIMEAGTLGAGTLDLSNELINALEVRNGIGGAVVANPNFGAQAPGTTSFVDGAGRTWTVNGTAQIIAGNTSSGASISPAGLDALPEVVDGWKEVSLRFSAPTVVGGTPAPLFPAYTWSSGDVAGNRYEILGANAPALAGTTGSLVTLVAAPNQLGGATYGQPSDGEGVSMTWLPQNGPYVATPTVDVTSDATLFLAQDLPAITGFGATVGTQVLTGIGQNCGVDPCCIPDRLLYNRLTWPGTTVNALFLPGISGSNASTPDNAVLDIVGDIDIRADINLTNWTLPTPATRAVVAKWVNAGNQLSYFFGLSEAGKLLMFWTTAGTGASAFFPLSTAAVAPPASGRLAIRATVDVDNGAGGWTTTFYTAPTIAGPWTVLGAPVVFGAITSIFSGSAPLEVGSSDNGTQNITTGMTVNAAEVRNGIAGAVVANPDFSAQPVGTTSFNDTAGRPWTLNGSARIQAFPAAQAVELQRKDTVETDFATIMLATGAVTGFSDYEARIGITSSYRIRQVDYYGFAGTWSNTISIAYPTPGVSGSCMDKISQGHILTFTSNERQNGSINLAYTSAWFDQQVSEDFTFPEAGFVQMQAMYDKDFFTAFRPLERGGEQFSRTVLVQAAAIPPETLADFRGLRDMAWDTVNYICVRDEDGNRWFATVLVPSGRVLNDRRLYLAPVSIIETNDVPTPVNP